MSSKLIRVYELLYQLHRDDPRLRQGLQALLERAGKVEEAIELAKTAPATAPAVVSPMECAGMYAPMLSSPVLEGLAEAVRIRARSGQHDRALAETAKLEGIAKKEGIAAYLATAQLYLELGTPEQTDRLIERASKEARSREDLRKVAFARERASRNRGSDLRPLYEEWRKSDDACLRLAATQHGQVVSATSSMLPSVPQSAAGGEDAGPTAVLQDGGATLGLSRRPR